MTVPNSNHYLAIDPGITSGWATFNSEGNPTNLGDVRGINEFLDWLDELEPIPKVIVIEEYKIRRTQVKQNASHGGKAETVQVIGAVKRFAYKHHIKIVEQSTQCKSIGYRYLGIRPSKNHRETHKTDAMAHGRYFLQKNKIVKSRLLEGK